MRVPTSLQSTAHTDSIERDIWFVGKQLNGTGKCCVVISTMLCHHKDTSSITTSSWPMKRYKVGHCSSKLIALKLLVVPHTAFNKARGYDIERENYLDHLRKGYVK